MSSKQNLKLLLRVCIMIGSIYCLWLVSSNSKSDKAAASSDPTAAQVKISIPVVANQLDLVDGRIPVELKCKNVELSVPNALEKLSCIIKNNTNEPISAGAVYSSIIVEKDGTRNVTSSYGTFDTFVHPDFREDHKNNLILPGQEYHYDEGSVSYDDGTVIKDIVVKLDYIEFANSTKLGTNQSGSRIIADARKGAAKYKNWLAQKYEEGGESLETIVPLLEKNQPLPDDLQFQTGPEEHGASMYRNYLRRTYKSKGAEGLVKFFKLGKSSTND